jgi:hypothetical protein
VTVGSVLGGILGLALIVGAIVCLARRRGKATETVASARWDNPELDDNQVRFQEAETWERRDNPELDDNQVPLQEAETWERRDNLELDGNQVWIQEAPVPVLVELSGQFSRPELQS